MAGGNLNSTNFLLLRTAINARKRQSRLVSDEIARGMKNNSATPPSVAVRQDCPEDKSARKRRELLTPHLLNMYVAPCP